ncbi:MAG TPA: hypothetical protein VJY33_06700, partial [Isosphaeraceae bacterium]|nr:hypothetical protein [Isosphaeraceae bacterium]
MIDFLTGASDNKRRLAARDVSNAQGRGEKVQDRAHPEGRDGEGRTREALSISIGILFSWDPEKKPENLSEIGRF